MSNVGTPSISNPFGWIRGPGFDLTLIVGVASLALGTGVAICFYPGLFPLLLLLDLWFLGYHHVVSTFTRLTFDVQSFKEYRFLVVWLPMIVAAVTIFAVYLTGSWILATTYLYWQWFHYMRQSYGISRVYQRKAQLSGKFNDLLEDGIIYLVPIWGILNRSYQNPGHFLGLELKVIPVAPELLNAVALTSLAMVVFWGVIKIQAFVQGKLDRAHTLFQLTHLSVFYVSYILIPSIDVGWLVINIWHNAQYVLFVWLFNNNRFKEKIDPQHKFLSTLSLSKHKVWYFGTCVLLAGIIYKSIELGIKIFEVPVLPWAIVVYQTINFHHYIVDGIIWKIRRKPIRDNLGLESAV